MALGTVGSSPTSDHHLCASDEMKLKNRDEHRLKMPVS